MAKLFFSYCHANEALRNRLEIHLALLKHQGLIETWHDRRILAGDNIDEAIDTNLESADVILLLVSADFIASRYCYSIEMNRALERHHQRTARVIPIIVDHCDWHSAPFGKLNAVPNDGKAITSWPNPEQALAEIAREVRKVIEAAAPTVAPAVAAPLRPSLAQFASQPALPQHSELAAVSASGAQVCEAPRSSNLRLKKQFTDFDRDKFLHDSFEYMVKFFDTSLTELASRNDGIQVRFQRIDAVSFAALIYRGGKVAAECSVRVGGLGGRSSMLSFSYNANASPGSSNEMLTVEVDTQSIYFKPMGMQLRGMGQNAQLSEQGASEHFWSLFIERLQ